MEISRSDPDWKSLCFARLRSPARKKEFGLIRRQMQEAGAPNDDAYEAAFHQVMGEMPDRKDAPPVPSTISPLSADALAAMHSVAAGKKANEKDYVRWVGQNWSKPEHEIDLQSAPCEEAVGMLAWVRADSANIDKFYSGVWSKVLTKSDLENRTEHTDHMLDLDQCQAALASVEKT